MTEPINEVYAKFVDSPVVERGAFLVSLTYGCAYVVICVVFRKEISGSDSELKAPTLGDGERVAVADACAIETVGCLIAVVVVEGHICHTRMGVNAEEVTFERMVEPIAGFELDVQEAHAIGACQGVGAVDEREVDGPMAADGNFNTYVCDSGCEICSVGF